MPAAIRVVKRRDIVVLSGVCNATPARGGEWTVCQEAYWTTDHRLRVFVYLLPSHALRGLAVTTPLPQPLGRDAAVDSG